MFRLALIVIPLCALFIFSSPVLAKDAESAAKLAQFQTALSEMNRLKPLQNPRYKLSDDILNRRLIDQHKKVVGEVQDAVIDISDNGKITSLLVDFDRLHLRQPVFLNYETLGISPTAGGYQIASSANSISEFYPELLANIQTASGDDGNIFSLSSVLGRTIKTSKGLRIGDVHDILFDQTGTFVKGAYLNLSYKTIRKKGIAVPLDALDFTTSNGYINVSIDQKYADTIIAFVKNQ